MGSTGQCPNCSGLNVALDGSPDLPTCWTGHDWERHVNTERNVHLPFGQSHRSEGPARGHHYLERKIGQRYEKVEIADCRDGGDRFAPRDRRAAAREIGRCLLSMST
jgi:hypothetical protein